MTSGNTKSFKNWALAGAAATVLAAYAPALAQDKQTYELEIESQELGQALTEFGIATGSQVLFNDKDINGVSTSGLEGSYTTAQAITALLDDTGIDYRVDDNGTLLVGNEYVRQARLEQENGPFRVAQLAQGDDVREVDARDEQDEESRQDVIVVTGTNIRGVSPDSSPSFVYDREDIDKTGFGTTSEFMQSLPQNFGGGAQAANILVGGGLPNDRTAALDKTFGSSVNLRGLGSGSTLVLLNGSRLAPTGIIGDFVDISMIPLSAVERVEVLTDGASAIYGADAIAGVVNFVLRDDFDGAESFVRVGSVTDGDLNEYRAGQTFGKSWDSGNALVSYEFYHRDNLGAEDRDFASAAPLPQDLLPKQTSHNVLLTASQELTDGISVRGHGTFSQRDGAADLTTAGLIVFDESRSKQYGGSVGADIELWGDWLLGVSGSYHKVTGFKDRTGDTTSIFDTDSDVWSVDGKADGTVFNLPGGDVKLAIGLSYREENFSAERPDLDLVLGDDGRNAFAVFAEAFIPIVGADNRLPGIERLEITAAGRYDEFSDFGDTFNPKVGLLWSPLDGLNFRGTYSTSFNPPNLGDTGSRSGDVIAVNVPNPTSPTGDSLAIFDRRSNLDLTAETSTAWTAGFDYTRNLGTGDLDVSVTWFDIGFEDRIGTAGTAFLYLNDPVVFADVIIANPDPALTATIIDDSINNQLGFTNFSTFFGSAIWTMPGDEEFIFLDKLLNLSTTNTSGLDVSLAYNVDANIGQLNLGLNSTYLFKQEKQITSGSPIFDVTDTVFNPVGLRLRGNASWNRDGITASAFVNYVDSYVDDRDLLGTGNIPVDSWTTVDLNLSYDTGERSTESLFNNTRFSLSVLNLFNQNPPFVENAFGSKAGFDPTNAHPLGRFISFQVTKAW